MIKVKNTLSQKCMQNKTICYLQEKYHKYKNTERLKGDNKGYHANSNLDKREGSVRD